MAECCLRAIYAIRLATTIMHESTGNLLVDYRYQDIDIAAGGIALVSKSDLHASSKVSSKVDEMRTGRTEVTFGASAISRC